MRIYECPDGRGGTTRLVLDWIVAVTIRCDLDWWTVLAHPLLGEPILVCQFFGYTSTGGDPDYVTKDRRSREAADAFAASLMEAIKRVPMPVLTLVESSS